MSSTDVRDPENQRAVTAAALADAKSTAATAIAAAARNAGKVGHLSSEFWTTLGAGAVSVLAIGLKAAAVIPGPWQIPALIVGVGVSAGGYALARGRVKEAALAAAGAIVAEAVPLALGARPAPGPAVGPPSR